MEPSGPQPSALPTTSSSPARDPASQALWSPDTPEYVPRFTCKYDDEQAEEEVHQEPGQGAVPKVTRTAEVKLQHTLGGARAAAAAKSPTGYGSSSFAPLAGRRPAI